MPELSEPDARQLEKMKLCIREFEQGRMSVDRLYNNLDFLWYQLTPDLDVSAKGNLKEWIDRLEILHASYMERIIEGKVYYDELPKILDSIKEYIGQLFKGQE